MIGKSSGILDCLELGDKPTKQVSSQKPHIYHTMYYPEHFAPFPGVGIPDLWISRCLMMLPEQGSPNMQISARVRRSRKHSSLPAGVGKFGNGRLNKGEIEGPPTNGDMFP